MSRNGVAGSAAGAKRKSRGIPQRAVAEKSPKYSAPALEKGLDILELFAGEVDGLSKSEVARRLNRTTSEVFRMLVCLQDRGYIRQDQNERYHLTLRLFHLAQQHPPVRRLVQEARPAMHEIVHHTQQSCHLAVVDGGEVVILSQMDSPSNIGFFVKAGSRLDLLSTGSGFVVLAHQNEYACTKATEMAKQRGTAIPRDFAGHLEIIRKRGFERRDSYQVRGVVNISFPIFDDNGEAIAALTMPFLPRLDIATNESKAIAALRRGAEALSAAMGRQ